MHYANSILGNLLLVAMLFVTGGQDLTGPPAFNLDQETQITPGPRGCTIIRARKDGLVLVGNNEDRNNTQTHNEIASGFMNQFSEQSIALSVNHTTDKDDSLP